MESGLSDKPPYRGAQPNILNLLCVVFCQGAFGLGGQDWVGPRLLVAGSYEVTPPWFGLVGGVDRSIRGQHRSVRQPVTGSDPTRIFHATRGKCLNV
jgi:hypothetical protein